MKQLKEYGNLHHLYCKSMKKFKIPFLICMMIFILAFGTFVIDNFPFGLSLAMLGMIFPAILFGILWLIAGIRTKMHVKSFSPQQLNKIDNEVSSCATCEGLFVTEQAIVGSKIGLELVPTAMYCGCIQLL